MLNFQLINSTQPGNLKNKVRKTMVNIGLKMPEYKEVNSHDKINKIILSNSVKYLKRIKDEGKLTEEQFSSILLMLISRYIESKVYSKINNTFDKFLNEF